MEIFSSESLLAFFEFNENGYVYFIAGLGLYIALILLFSWIAIGIYVFTDLRKRGAHIVIAILLGILAFVFNIPGIIVYLIVRPKKTSDELEWEELERKFISQDIDTNKECYNCKTIVKSDFLYCVNCGITHKTKCECGYLLDGDFVYCPICHLKNKFHDEYVELRNATLSKQKLKKKNIKIAVPKIQKPITQTPGQQVVQKTNVKTRIELSPLFPSLRKRLVSYSKSATKLITSVAKRVREFMKKLLEKSIMTTPKSSNSYAKFRKKRVKRKKKSKKKSKRR